MTAEDDDPESESGDDEWVSTGDELIDDDMPCIRCSYNLRGLRPDGRCPECGEEVEKTIEFVMQRVLCPNCLRPNHPMNALCLGCGNPLSASAMTANFGLRRSIAPRKKVNVEDDEDAEPHCPSLAWIYIGYLFSGVILVELALRIASIWSNPGQPLETQTMVLRGHVIATLPFLAAAIVPILIVALASSNHIRIRREYMQKHAEYSAREAAKDAAYKEPGASEEEA